MNTDMLEGKWKEIKGSVRAKWGELTDDEVEQVAGNTERLAGLIQQKYGRSKEEAKREVNDFIDSL
ncbi:CsbD family protein [Paenirhodobacter hankyongi]|uniref:CsbD family protein n=1 Tax=Paenirhodobacter hankyongi TaxID=2294033 RepID=A0A421BXE4_9RHOB|nr:CsbD family protein [Sinirhodobacter hankyongi]RLL72975.1 CsbD family protein [Sinirhodobacter hankyongi]